MPTLVSWWWWELLGGICSLSFLLAIFNVLYLVDNRPISEWHFRIQPNALVSVLATISKSTLILTVAECLGQLKWEYFSVSPRRMKSLEAFDGASRGPAGAVRFLFSLREQYFFAKGAALITIMAILMEPFIQQVISFSTRQMTVVATTSATVYVTKAFDYRPSGYNSHGYAFSDCSIYLRGAAAGAIYGIERKPSFTCMGSECVWRNLSTLGVCTFCEDVSAMTTQSCGAVRYPDNFNTTGNGSFALDYCNYTFPGHSMLRAQAGNPRFPFPTTFNYSFSPATNDLSSPVLGRFGALTFPLYLYAPIPTPNVTQCTISLCAKIFPYTIVANGTYTSSTPESVPFAKGVYERGNWVYSVDKSNYPDFPGDTSFRIHVDSREDLIKHLKVLLTGSDHKAYTSEVKALARSPDLGETIMNVSSALTDGLRECSPNRTPVSGETLASDTYMEVRWAWMILPCVLVLAGNALLISTIVLSDEGVAPLWKNSSLALLFNGMSEIERERIDRSRLTTQQGMEKEAENVRVALEARKDGRQRLTFSLS